MRIHYVESSTVEKTLCGKRIVRVSAWSNTAGDYVAAISRQYFDYRDCPVELSVTEHFENVTCKVCLMRGGAL